jgi:hypothetical protein
MKARAAAALGNATREVSVTVPVELSLSVNDPVPPFADKFDMVIDETLPLATNVPFTGCAKFGSSKFSPLYAVPESGAPSCDVTSMAQPFVSVAPLTTTLYVPS